MSAAIKLSKANYRGDPGLFGFLGKALGTVGRGLVGAATGFVTGGPGGAIMGAARTVLGSKPQVLMTASPSPGTVLTAGNMPGLPALPGVGTPPLAAQGGGIMIGGPRGVQIGRYAPTYPTSGAGQPAQNGAGCLRGHHLNRTGYFTKSSGWVEKGTVCVRNRRRNPLNPRALSRAMSRLASAKKATDCLKRYSIREPKCARCG